MPPKSKKKKLNVRRAILLAAIILFLVVVGLGTGLVVAAVRDMPTFDLEAMQADATGFLLDKDGNVYEHIHGPEDRVPVSFDQIPKNLKEAFLAAEDHNFYNHGAISIVGIARAALVNLRSGRIEQGGSTITQQLANMAFIGHHQRTFERKIQEAILAFQLERNLTKDQIFEQYMNWAYFGRGAYGVQSAAQAYFGKDVKDLSLSECAFLAGLVKSPGTFSKDLDAAIARRNVVLDLMASYDFISPEAAQQAKAEKLNFVEDKDSSAGYKYPYFTEFAISQAEKLLEANGMDASELFRAGLKVYTTLDPKVQQAMEDVYANPNNFPPSKKDRLIQSAMVVLDPATGEVRGVVGGRGDKVQRGFNFAVPPAGRQPGSSIKPVAVYAPAIEQGYTPATVIDDVPTSFPGYRPSNYDGKYRGLISMREAIQWSVNVAAVKMLDTIGVDKGFQFARNLGLPLKNSDRHLAMALGGITTGVSPLDMAAAYAAFANKGIYTEPHAVIKIEDRYGNVIAETKPQRRAVMSEQTAYLVTDMLRTVVQSGTGTRAQLGSRPVAGKTGTTELPKTPEFRGKSGIKDAWFVGYTPELVGAVWMGYEPTDPEHYLVGVAGGGHPARIWKAVMSRALAGVPVHNFPMPGGLVYATIDAKSGLLPSPLTPQEFIRSEIFAQGTVPTQISNVWEEKQICAESGKLATPYCPNVITKVFLKRPVPFTGSPQPLDAVLEAPKDTCPLHGAGSTVQVKVCTDPRHGGELYLANIPGPGQTGGCSPEMVQERSFAKGTEPTRHCPLPDHQVSDSTTGPPGAVTLDLKADRTGKTSVKLSWKSSPSDFYLYNIYRGESLEAMAPVFPQPKAIPRLQWTDDQVQPGKTYYYQVKAYDPVSGDELAASDPVPVPIPPNGKT